MTLFKMSKGPKNVFKGNVFPSKVYGNYSNFEFGDFTFDSLELNQMKRKDDYYISEKILKF
jgi:hypothetical protein